MQVIEFRVSGSPVAQPRARSRGFIAGYKNGKPIVKAGVYEPQTTKDKNTGIRKLNPIYEWKQSVKQAALDALGLTTDDLVDARGAGLWTGPVAMNMTIYFPRPQRLYGRKFPDGPLCHFSKPDRDNCEKAILDAIKGVVFVDDCQVCAGEVRKFYHEKEGHPRAEIRLEQIA